MSTITLGLHYGMPAEQYHQTGDVSNTILSTLSKSPAHCHALHLAEDRPEREATAAMKAGTLLHCVALEPLALLDRYAIKPTDYDGRTTAGKEWARAAAGREIIGSDQLAVAAAQREALLKIREIADVIASDEVKTEVSAFWRHDKTGLICRARPDALKFTGRKRAVVIDLKTTTDVSDDAFSRTIATYGYHRQAAFYTAGLEACGIEVEAFIFGAVTNAYPFLAKPYVLDDESLIQGQEEIAELLELYAQCRSSGKWPLCGEGVQLIGLPKWARRSAEVEVSYA